MAIDVTKIKSDIADTSKDIEDLTKSINKLISSTKSLSTDTLQNSKDLVSIYGQLFVSVRSISDENKKSKIVEDAVNNINKQRTEILNRVNELKQKGIILDADSVEVKKNELKIENDLIDKKLKMLNKQKAATGTWDVDKLKFLEQEIRQLEIKKQYNNVENKVLDDRVKKGNEILNKLQEQYKRLGLVAGVYNEILKDAIEWKKQLEEIEKLFGGTGKEMGKMVKNIFSGNYKEAFLSYINIVVDRFVELQKEGEDFRKTTGLMVSQMGGMDVVVRNINIEYQKFGVSLSDAYNVVKGLVNEFGTLSIVSESLVETSALLKANYGVTENTSAGFLANISRISDVSSSVAGNYASYAVNLSKASMVPLPKIMESVKNASNDTLGLLRGNSAELIKAATHAHKYGVEINNIAGAARKMLNFYESVNDEMEASVILGQPISLQKARELSFSGKIVEFQDEILNIVESIGDFNERSILEKEALAKATGMELKDLMKMVNNKREIDKLGSAEKARYYELLKLNNQQVELTGKELLQQQEMQSAMTKLENAFKRIKLIIAEAIGPALNNIANVMSSIADLMGGTTDQTKKLTDATKETKSSLGSWGILLVGVIGSLAIISGLIWGLNKAMLVLGRSSRVGLSMFASGIRSFTTAGAGLGVFAGVMAVVTLSAMGLAYAFKMVAEGTKTFVEGIQILATMGIEDVAKSILLLGASIVGLQGAFTAASFLSVTGLVGQMRTLNFLNDLVEMQTGLENVAKSLEKIANSLLTIQGITSFPKIKPVLDEGQNLARSSTEMSDEAKQIVKSTKVESTRENQNDITLLTDAVKDLVTYLKSGNAISTVNLDNRKVSREMAASPVTRRYAA